MASLVNYDIYEDSTEENEQVDKAKDAAESSKKMEDEWEDFERLISEKQVDNYIKKEKDMVYPSAVSNKDGEDRLKNLKFDVGNFVNHNETSRYSQDGKVIKEDTNETKEKDKDEKSKNDDKKDKYSPGDKRKRSRSHSKSRRHKQSSSSSQDSKHRHRHHHHHKKRKRSRSPRHRHHRRRHRHSRQSSSSSRSPSPSRGRRGRQPTRAVLSFRHKRMLMMNREASMKTQVTNKLVEAMIAPSMKSGTTLPKVFGDINVETLKEQLKDVYGKTLDQIQIDESKLLKASEKKSALPLLNNEKHTISTSINSTPQDVLSQTMAAMHAKVQELTGVAIPKYYKPAAVNPLKYADQLKKRKLLWNKDKQQTAETTTTSSSTSKWAGTTLLADDSGKMSAKFSKLMGIKQTQPAKNVDEEKKKREELFHNLESEYEQARHTTHSFRGVGLGFASQQHMP